MKPRSLFFRAYLSIMQSLYNSRSSPTARSLYVCHFQGNYKENKRVGQASQLRPQSSQFHLGLMQRSAAALSGRLHLLR